MYDESLGKMEAEAGLEAFNKGEITHHGHGQVHHLRQAHILLSPARGTLETVQDMSRGTVQDISRDTLLS